MRAAGVTGQLPICRVTPDRCLHPHYEACLWWETLCPSGEQFHGESVRDGNVSSGGVKGQEPPRGALIACRRTGQTPAT